MVTFSENHGMIVKSRDDGELAGVVLVGVNEAADPADVVHGLLRIAAWIDAERREALTAKPPRVDGCPF